MALIGPVNLALGGASGTDGFKLQNLQLSCTANRARPSHLGVFLHKLLGLLLLLLHHSRLVFVLHAARGRNTVRAAHEPGRNIDNYTHHANGKGTAGAVVNGEGEMHGWEETASGCTALRHGAECFP